MGLELWRCAHPEVLGCMVVLSWIASSDSVASWVAASYYAARGRFPSFRWVLYVTLCYYKKYQKTEGRFPRLSVAEDERCGRIPRRMPREILARGFLEIRFRPDAGVPTSSSRRFRPRRFRPRRFRRGAARRTISDFGSRYTLGCCVPARLFGLARWGKGEKMLAGG